MNPELRKVALIAAVLGLLVSLVVALRPDDDEDAAATTTAAVPASESQVVRARIVVRDDAAPTVEKLSVQRDKQVVLLIEADAADDVHVHGYDLSAAVAPGQPATIRFKASAPGIFAVELEGRGLPLGELEVRP